MSEEPISEQQYRLLAELRYRIRRFLHFSEQAARRAGLEPQQHQLLLVVKGLPEGTEPTIRNIAERLQLQHHTVVELVDRLVARQLVARNRSEQDRRKVLITLTDDGERVLVELSRDHLAELRSAGRDLIQSLGAIVSGLNGRRES